MKRTTLFLQHARLLSLSAGLTVLLGLADYATGGEISFSVFYLIPVLFITWSSGRWAGVTVAILASFIWLGADLSVGRPYSITWIPVWNMIVRFGFFFVASYLLIRLKRSLEHQKKMANLDPLTGLANWRSFKESADIELKRAKRFRQYLTMVYIDLDNFKSVNDALGHSTGDQLLKSVAETLTTNIRIFDIAARMGGDEFAILMPEPAESTPVDFERIRQLLLNEMKRNGWQVTFSIGIVNYKNIPDSVSEMVKRADEVMYSVKRGGKNAIRYLTI